MIDFLISAAQSLAIVAVMLGLIAATCGAFIGISCGLDGNYSKFIRWFVSSIIAATLLSRLLGIMLG